MARDIRYLPRPGAEVEITVQAAQNRYLFRPSDRFNRLYIGVLAKAQHLTGLRLHAVVVLSTHYHLLASPATVEQMAAFMRYVNTNLSKQVGRLHDWPGALFAGRYSSIPVSDEPDAQIRRLSYLLSQGTKENLVWTPGDWPGVHAVEALRTGKPLGGRWVDRTRIYAAHQRGEALTEIDVAEEVHLELAPLPCWAHLAAVEHRRYVSELVEAIERETIERHRRHGTVPMGAAWVLRQHPHKRHRLAARSPRPRFHATRKSVRKALQDAHVAFVAAYRKAAERLRVGAANVRFPENCFPPRLPFVPTLSLLEPG